MIPLYVPIRRQATCEGGNGAGGRNALTWGTQPDFQSAADRSCDNQKNNCAELANNGEENFEVSDCDRQNGGFFVIPQNLYPLGVYARTFSRRCTTAGTVLTAYA